ISLPAGMSYSSGAFDGTVLETIKLVKCAKHASISANTSNAATNFTSSNAKYTPWYVASQQRKVNLIVGTGINKITNFAFNGSNASNLTIFVEDASIATVGSNNVPYTNATKYFGLGTAWEYNTTTGLPQVKEATEA
ncbi:MAG: hypothetical protein J6A46_00890, partial [Clostridia bacterium]|nr:hypothetical protein [Clostridia bacterium]